MPRDSDSVVTGVDVGQLQIQLCLCAGGGDRAIDLRADVSLVESERQAHPAETVHENRDTCVGAVPDLTDRGNVRVASGVDDDAIADQRCRDGGGIGHCHRDGAYGGVDFLGCLARGPIHNGAGFCFRCVGGVRSDIDAAVGDDRGSTRHHGQRGGIGFAVAHGKRRGSSELRTGASGLATLSQVEPSAGACRTFHDRSGVDGDIAAAGDGRAVERDVGLRASDVHRHRLQQRAEHRELPEHGANEGAIVEHRVQQIVVEVGGSALFEDGLIGGGGLYGDIRPRDGGAGDIDGSGLRLDCDQGQRRAQPARAVGLEGNHAPSDFCVGPNVDTHVARREHVQRQEAGDIGNNVCVECDVARLKTAPILHMAEKPGVALDRDGVCFEGDIAGISHGSRIQVIPAGYLPCGDRKTGIDGYGFIGDEFDVSRCKKVAADGKVVALKAQ